jgi:hypothetical protein
MTVRGIVTIGAHGARGRIIRPFSRPCRDQPSLQYLSRYLLSPRIHIPSPARPLPRIHADVLPARRFARPGIRRSQRRELRHDLPWRLLGG